MRIIPLSVKYYLNSPERCSPPRSNWSFFRDLSNYFSVSILYSLNLSKDSDLWQLGICTNIFSNHQQMWWSVHNLPRQAYWLGHIHLYELIQEVKWHISLRSWRSFLSSFLPSKIHKVALIQNLMGPRSNLWSIFVFC